MRSAKRKKPPGPSLLERLRNQARPKSFETNSGLAMEGGEIKDIWTAAGTFAQPEGTAGWWRIGQAKGFVLKTPAPVLIEFTDGLFAASAILPGFIASLLRDRRGVAGLIYRPVGSPPTIAASAEMAIAELEKGALRADFAIDAAVDLRQMKHADPMLGVISAYLYDSIGDTASVRRMAYYYIKHRQPIPYDIALLAQIKAAKRGGLLHVQVPAVVKREPRTKAEQNHAWTYAATPAATGVVGGLWPWMRQGWTFLDDLVDDRSKLVIPGLAELMPSLEPARFTTLSAKGGRKLTRLLDLRRNRRQSGR